MMPPDALKTLSSHDAILLGAVGRPDVPDHISLRGLLREKTGLTPDVGGTASTSQCGDTAARLLGDA